MALDSVEQNDLVSKINQLKDTQNLLVLLERFTEQGLNWFIPVINDSDGSFICANLGSPERAQVSLYYEYEKEQVVFIEFHNIHPGDYFIQDCSVEIKLSDDKNWSQAVCFFEQIFDECKKTAF